MFYHSDCCLGTKLPEMVVRESFFILPDLSFPSRFLFKKNKQEKKKKKSKRVEVRIRYKYDTKLYLLIQKNSFLIRSLEGHIL